MSVNVSGKRFVFDDHPSGVVYDVDGTEFTSYGLSEGEYYRKIAWDGDYLDFVSDFLVSSPTVYSVSGAGWTDERFKTIEFMEGEVLSDADYAWMETMGHFVESVEEELYLVTRDELEDVADAIRAKSGTQSELEFPSGFVTAVQNIPTGATWASAVNIANVYSINIEEGV
jgi:hypothetical protein